MSSFLLLNGMPAARPTDARVAMVREVIADMTDAEYADLVEACVIDDDADDGDGKAEGIAEMILRTDEWVDLSFDGSMTPVIGYGNPYFEWMITGGESYGDPHPTEASRVIESMTAIPRVYEMLELWAQEDYVAKLREEKDGLWNNDGIQFARVLGELAAVASTETIKEMEESMDLEPEELAELLERGQKRWDQIKAAMLTR